MKAWRFYGFGDMRLDEVPVPTLSPKHVLAQILCVQPSVTEAQLAFGVRTLAFEKINIQMISTSEIKISLLVEETQLERAVQALHTAYGLSDKVVKRCESGC